MNELIKQLMGKTLDDKFSHTWTTMTYEDLEKFSEQFAELIIKECAHAADYVSSPGLSEGEVIKRHFGVEECWCESCKPNTMTDMRMILCQICGNKRCPHATNHNNECTNSNEPGQKGSSWENYKV